MLTVTGSQRTGLFKMMILARLPGCMPICIGGKGTTVTLGIGTRAPEDPQLAPLSNQSGKKSSAR